MNAIELIAAERKRQIEVEGWTLDHDDRHDEGQLADAAATYAISDNQVEFLDEHWGDDQYLLLWPFDLKWLKKKRNAAIDQRIRDLVKAGALIVAEIERLNRIQQ